MLRARLPHKYKSTHLDRLAYLLTAKLCMFIFLGICVTSWCRPLK